jgi:D-alanyl-lipoteichoic acid acyltransferase DltB (MBOAT superfamily)
MLFNSHVFIFLFLPLVLGGYYGLRKLSVNDRLPMVWLLLLSVFFYGWWEARYVVLLAISIAVNFNLGKMLFKAATKQAWLVVAVVFNLGLLAYFKYAYFIVDNLGTMLGTQWTIDEIVLPLAISFFTFQQIAWLVDISKSKAAIPTFYNYALFVSFFPQLIAGPIVHHAEMMPQFERRHTGSETVVNLNVGLTIFTLGLFKKIILADQFALYANPVFDAAAQGASISMFEAWFGTLAYTFQLYFDFSGYSDMAVGLARMFGIVLPLNFFSPYKAGNIREFWQRWHITLSRFLRDYLYIPLGGNRATTTRVSANIMITMLIGGLWHGAAWTFVAWGGLHGFYLLVHRAWSGRRTQPGSAPTRAAGVLATFVAVTLAWVLFRAESFDAALAIYRGMFGLSGDVVLQGLAGGVPGLTELAWLIAGGLICFFAPNAYQFMAGHQPALIPPNIDLDPGRLRWHPGTAWALAFAALLAWSVLSLSRVSEFLYFQF